MERNRNEANQGELEILRSRQQIIEAQRAFVRKKSQSIEPDSQEVSATTAAITSSAKSSPVQNSTVNETNSPSKSASGSTSDILPPVPTKEAGEKNVEATEEKAEQTSSLPPVTLEFPPPARDNEIIKKAVSYGFFTKEDFLAYLEYYKAPKLSDLILPKE